MTLVCEMRFDETYGKVYVIIILIAKFSTIYPSVFTLDLNYSIQYQYTFDLLVLVSL